MTGTTYDKSKGKISQNFVAFSEYMNFNAKKYELNLEFSISALEKKVTRQRRDKRSIQRMLLRRTLQSFNAIELLLVII